MRKLLVGFSMMMVFALLVGCTNQNEQGTASIGLGPNATQGQYVGGVNGSSAPIVNDSLSDVQPDLINATNLNDPLVGSVNISGISGLAESLENTSNAASGLDEEQDFAGDMDE
ncbi:hypothetical protein KJ780_04970 [Candidatus Micrarchaeota archaeon]|nr:hypothetical protein [Candidatus Micrarchaeota archaeon]